MIGECLGLNGVNILFLNIETLDPLLKIMSSPANIERLRVLGADCYYINRKLNETIEHGFTDPAIQRKFKSKSNLLQSANTAEQRERYEREIAELQANNKQGFSLVADFHNELSYLFLWKLYLSNHNLSAKDLASGKTEFTLPDNSKKTKLINILYEIPEFSAANERLFGVELNRLATYDLGKFRYRVKQILADKNRQRAIRTEDLDSKMKAAAQECTKYDSFVSKGNQDLSEQSSYHNNTDVISTFEPKLNNLDTGDVVWLYATETNVVSSYCRIFNKSYEHIQSLINEVDSSPNKKALIQSIYDDLEQAGFYGFNFYNAQFYDACISTLVHDGTNSTNIKGLDNLKSVFMELEEVIDSIQNMFMPIERVGGNANG